jgi:hypothetical protein
MPGFAENGGQFEVHCSGAIARSLKDLQKQATLEGRGEQVLKAIQQIWHRLVHEPFEFGEPLYRLPAMRMQVRHGAVLPLFVDFAVCEDRPLVFIKGVKLL